MNLPVAILGAGVSGKAVCRFLSEEEIPFAVYDRSGVDGARTDFAEADARKHGFVVYSPGFPPDHPWLRAALAGGQICLGETDFAAREWHARNLYDMKILTAVTGTNGKTTLTEFLAFAHREAGRRSVAVGNNGIPFTTLLFKDAPKVDLPICEISSFQAEYMEHLLPGNLLWTNFDEDHLDRHGSSENYFRAKFRLVELQQRERASGVCIIGESVAAAARHFGISFPGDVQIATRGEVRESVPEGSIFETFPQRENYAVAKRYWLANGFPLEELESAAKKFAPKAHRLARCAFVEVSGTQIEFWNDSKGTNFHAVYAALATFSDVPVFWVGGGLGKGGDLSAFCCRLAPKIKAAFLIGETSGTLKQYLAENNVASEIFENLSGAVDTAFCAAKKSGASRAVVLFSPGFASFDMFKSYAERGTQFEQLAKSYCR